MSETPRPDQRVIYAPNGLAGSRSGAGDIAGALGYPGIAPAVLNCQSTERLHQNVSGSPVAFFTFPVAGRIWSASLSFVITSNPSFALPTARTYAVIRVSPGPPGTLAVIDLGVAGPSQHAEGQAEPNRPGLPVTAGQSLVLDINGGTLITNLDQQASASVFYSIP